MPKTVEELEQELKTQQATYEGKLTALDTALNESKADLETLKAHAIALTDKLKGFEQAERDALENQFHAVTKDLTEDQQKAIADRLGPLDQMSNSEVESFVKGAEIAHAVATPDPKKSHTTPGSKPAPEDSRTRAQKLLDGDL